MSVEYYLVCHQCRQRIHVAQDGLSGWTFYRGEPDCMQKLGAWMEEHSLDKQDHTFALHAEWMQFLARLPGDPMDDIDKELSNLQRMLDEFHVKRLPAGRAHGLDPVTIGDLIYAQHNAGPDFRRPANDDAPKPDEPA